MALAARDEGATLTVDLDRQEITAPNGETTPFDVDPFRKDCLLGGLDEIGLTLQKAPAIAAFEERHKASQPWLFR